MAQNQANGSVTVYRLKSGETVNLYFDVVGGLYQSVINKQATPDFSKSHPKITPKISGAQIVSGNWYVNLPANTSETQRDEYNVTKKPGIYQVDAADFSLKIVNTPVEDFTNLNNFTYTFICDVNVGSNESLSKSIVLLVRKGGDNSYWGQISAPNGNVLSNDNDRITLVADLYKGGGEAIKSGVKYKWVFSGEEGTTLGTDKSLTLSRAQVDGAAHVECHFYVNEQEVEAEGIQVVDIADEYYINISGDTNVRVNGSVKLTAGAYKRNGDLIVPVKVKGWNVVFTDSERMNEYPENVFSVDTNDNTADITIQEENMRVPNTGVKKDDTKKWLSLGAGADQDVPVSDRTKATPCNVNVFVRATI